jgi:predicted transcriptional regulator
MLAPCEVAVKCGLPAIRAMIAKRLMANYGLKQAETAQLLGVSQPAISLYYRKIRGKAINLENDSEIKDSIEELARRLSQRNLPNLEFISAFCDICRKMRAKGLLCEVHKTLDPSIDIENCEHCKSTTSVGCIRR